MEKPKKSFYWKITIIISNIIAMGFIIRIILSPLSIAVLGKNSFILDLLITPLIIFLGVWYAVRYISKKSILNAGEAKGLALTAEFLPFLGLCFVLVANILPYFISEIEPQGLDWLIGAASFLMITLVTYYSTKHFVKKFANQG